MLPELVIFARAFLFLACLVAMLGTIGLPLALWLSEKAWSRYALLAAPLFGWTILTAWCYAWLTYLTFAPSLAILVAVVSTALAPRVARRGIPARRWVGSLKPRHAIYVLITLAYWAAVLAPYLYHSTLAITVPNQDEEYFVEVADMFWAFPQGSRFQVGGYHLETGWGFHVAVALSRLIPFVHAFESILLVGQATLLIMASGTFVLARECLGLSRAWSVTIALVAPLHSLVLWVPGYAFGPNAVAAAVVPWYAMALMNGLRRPSPANGVVLASSTAMLLMAYTKVSAIQLACIGAALLVIGASRAAARDVERLRRIRSAISWHVVGAAVGSGALVDSFIWLFSGGLDQVVRLLSDSSETTGAGWNLTTFPGFGTWLGTAFWEFLGARLGLAGNAVVAAIAVAGTVSGVVLVATGLMSPRFETWRLGLITLVVGHAAFFVYARWLKAFPYAVFKLQSLSACLLVVVTIVGVHDVVSGVWRDKGLVGAVVGRLRVPRTLGQLVGIVGVTAFVVGYGTASALTVIFHAQPFGTMIDASRLSEISRIATRIPPRSSVMISGVTGVGDDPGTFSPTSHPIGFMSAADARRASGDRIRSLLAHDLRLRDIDTYGVFRREVNDTVRPPGDQRVDYFIAGVNEDLRVNGYPDANVLDDGAMLRLVKAPAGGPPQLHALNGANTIRVPVPCPSTSPGVCPSQSATVGVFAPDLAKLEFLFECGSSRRTVAVMVRRGLTWYRTPSFDPPCTMGIRLLGASPPKRTWVAILPTGDAGRDPTLEQAIRSTGAVSATLTGDGAIDVTVAHTSAMAEGELQRLRVTLVSSPVRAGRRFATDVDPSRPFQEWRWVIRPGDAVAQFINGARVEMPFPVGWPADEGPFWVRLSYGDGDTTWHDVPIITGRIEGGRAADVTVVAPLFEVPLPESSVAAPPRPQPTGPRRVVQGSGADVFVIDGGVLRWIPSPEAFTRDGWRWEDIVAVPDDVLDSIPLGFPIE